jgi:ABC-2 type transport system permease protein
MWLYRGDKMIDGIRMYFKYISISIQSQMQYRASFIMLSIAQFAVTLIDFIGVWVLFDRFGALKDWSMPEVALFYGIVHISFAISEAWSRGFDTFHLQVRSGEFDRMLLRPRSTVLQVLGHDFQMMRSGRFIQGLVVLIWAMWSLKIRWTIGKTLLLLGGISGGVLLFSGLFVLQATLSFWSVQSLELVNTTTYGGVETAQFPLSIYSKWFRNFFIFIIPLACINYFPAMGVLDKADPLGFPGWVHWTSPLIGFAFFMISLRIWKLGIKFYCSTGS